MKAPADCQTMQDLRVQIDLLDAEIVAKLVARAGYIDRAIELKQDRTDACPDRMTGSNRWSTGCGRGPDRGAGPRLGGRPLAAADRMVDRPRGTGSGAGVGWFGNPSWQTGRPSSRTCCAVRSPDRIGLPDCWRDLAGRTGVHQGRLYPVFCPGRLAPWPHPCGGYVGFGCWC